MYLDLSVVPANLLDLNHLLRGLQGSAIGAVAVDYEYCDTALAPLPESFAKLQQSHPSIKMYSRATLVIEQTATLHQLNQVGNPGYDIVAVRPKNEKIFHALCVEYENYDLICLEIGAKLPFMLKRNPVYEALRRGKYFELQYASVLEDATRVTCLTNMINIIKATNARNLIVTSHANDTRLQRTPYDVAALMASLGLSKNLALSAMKENAETVIKSALHRQFFKGTVKELPPSIVKKIGKKIQKHREGLRKVSQRLIKQQL